MRYLFHIAASILLILCSGSGTVQAAEEDNAASAADWARRSMYLGQYYPASEAVVIFHASELLDPQARRASLSLSLPFQNRLLLTGAFSYRMLDVDPLQSLVWGATVFSRLSDSSQVTAFAGVLREAVDHQRLYLRRVSLQTGLQREAAPFQLLAALELDYIRGTVLDEGLVSHSLDLWPLSLHLQGRFRQLGLTLKYNPDHIVYSLGWSVKL